MNPVNSRKMRFKKDEKHDDPENHFPSMENIKIKNLTDLNCLLKATGIVIMERLGVIQKTENNRKNKSNKDSWWKRRLKKSIKELKKDVSISEEIKKGTTNWVWQKNNSWTGSTNLMPKAICTAQSQNIKSLYQTNSRQYNKNRQQYHQNNLFKTNGFRLYSQLNGDTITEMNHLTLKTKKKNWKDIWATPTSHNSNAAWLKVVKNKQKYLERHLSLLWGCETWILV